MKGAVALLVGAFVLGVGGALPSGSAATEEPAQVSGQVPVAQADSTWTRPIDAAGVQTTAGFGRYCVTGQECKAHEGIDLVAPRDTPIHAVADGTVAKAACGSPYCDRDGHIGLGGYGNNVLIDHAGGTSTLYAHMSRFSVNTGDQVKAGDVVGYLGGTGNVTGPHLHLEVRQSGEATDPSPFFQAKGITLGQAA